MTDKPTIDRNFFLNRDPALDPVLTDVPELGSCYIRKISQSEYTQKITMWISPKGKTNRWREGHLNLRFIQLCASDAAGNELFGVDDFDVIAANTSLHTITTLANLIGGHGTAEEDDETLGE